MNTYILTLVLFLSHNLVETRTISAPTMADCETNRPLIEREYQGKSILLAPSKTKEVVLDAQTTPCQKVTQRHAS